MVGTTYTCVFSWGGELLLSCPACGNCCFSLNVFRPRGAISSGTTVMLSSTVLEPCARLTALFPSTKQQHGLQTHDVINGFGVDIERGREEGRDYCWCPRRMISYGIQK